MTETDISKVLIEGEYATIMGVKYKRVEEPKPKMTLENESEFSIVSYDGYIYYRLKYPTDVIWYSKSMTGILEPIRDKKTKNEMESQWLVNNVKYQNDEEPYCPDEPEYYDEVEWDEKDNSKPMDEVVNRLLEKWKTDPPEFLKFELGKTLEDLITRWWCDVFTTREDWDMETAIDDLIDQIQLWLPREQSAEGSQSVSVIDTVDGYNDCLTKIKSKLRNKR